MLIYLVRHGEALSEADDPARSLSEAGRDHVRRIGRFVSKNLIINPVHIFHSSKTRALQTAGILGEELPLSDPPSPHDALLPHDDPSIWSDRLQNMDSDVLLVGHLPHLSRLVSFLILTDPDGDAIIFSPGSILCMEKTDTCKVKWMLSPEVLKGESKIQNLESRF
jgi:phosphohistidine phosphatase